MDTKIKEAIDTLAAKISGDVKPDDALKFTQAALNMAHVAATLSNMEKK